MGGIPYHRASHWQTKITSDLGGENALGAHLTTHATLRGKPRLK